MRTVLTLQTIALTALRNQFTIKPNDDIISPQDDRLSLAKAWLEEDPGLRQVFEIWEGLNQVQSDSTYHSGH